VGTGDGSLSHDKTVIESGRKRKAFPALSGTRNRPLSHPYLFNPIGLQMVVRPGTKNGKIISWMGSGKREVFRWDENPNFPNGSHYHIYGQGHYIPGIDAVPEPYSTVYFPFG